MTEPSTSGPNPPVSGQAPPPPPATPPPAEPAPPALTPEEQMALFERDLIENDTGHRPC